MAAGVRFRCGNCAREIEAWDEGNPYYVDGRGRKRYAYHTDPRRLQCTGVDSPMLCLGCGAEVMSDSEAPLSACPHCASVELVDTWHLAGRPCPNCKQGRFAQVPDEFMIS